MIDLDILVEDAAWESVELAPLATQIAAVFVRVAPDQLRAGEAALLFTSDAAVCALNREFRGKDKPTNVLSFPADGEGLPPDVPAPLGDIALAWGVTADEATAKNVPVQDHTAHLIIHGLLHLLGYDHIEDDEAEEMESIERQMMMQLGLHDPYEVMDVADATTANDGDDDG